MTMFSTAISLHLLSRHKRTADISGCGLKGSTEHSDSVPLSDGSSCWAVEVVRSKVTTKTGTLVRPSLLEEWL